MAAIEARSDVFEGYRHATHALLFFLVYVRACKFVG